MTLHVMAETTSYNLPGCTSNVGATYLLRMSVNIDMDGIKCTRYLHALNLLKKLKHSPQHRVGRTVTLVIIKRVIYEEQRQLRSVVKAKEMGNYSFIKPTYGKFDMHGFIYEQLATTYGTNSVEIGDV
jgi:hypothetical protein